MYRFVCKLKPALTHARCTQNIDETKLVRLGGNARPEATAANDRGIVGNSFLMDHMLLQLRRTPEQEQASLPALKHLDPT